MHSRTAKTTSLLRAGVIWEKLRPPLPSSARTAPRHATADGAVVEGVVRQQGTSPAHSLREVRVVVYEGVQ